MEFKIDTNDQYLHIKPLAAQFDDKMAASLLARLQQYPDEAAPPRRNIILDLKNCQSMAPGTTAVLHQIHQYQYENGQSFVVTEAQGETLAMIRQEDQQKILQLAPRFQEALDIVHMEILERDLLEGEDSENPG